MIEEFVRVMNNAPDWMVVVLFWAIALIVVSVIVIIYKRVCRHTYRHIGYVDGSNILRCTKCDKIKYKEYRQ